MSRLPQISGRDCVSALLKAGFTVKRQRGSHIVLRRDEPYAQVVVPDHRQLDRGTVRTVLRHAGLSTDDLLGLL